MKPLSNAETRRLERRRRLTSRSLLILCFTFQVSAFILSSSASPSWWTSRGVVGTNAPVADYSPVIMGQLKWMATNACDELQACLADGAGTNVQNLVRGFSNSNNWLVVNIGQVKYVAAPFYDRLIEAGYTNAYPWTGVSPTNDYALANIGQLKNVFAFELRTFDSDNDGLPDWWELQYFGSIGHIPGPDQDGDGLNDIQEAQKGTSPFLCDTDGDGVFDNIDPHPTTKSDTNNNGMSDDWELYYFGNLNQTANGDYDNDGVSNLDEFRNGTDPTKVNVSDSGNATGLTVFTPVE